MNPEKRVLAIIENIYNDADAFGACTECEHYECTIDREPYGDQRVERTTCECTVPDENQCPYVKRVLEMMMGVVK